MMNKVLVEIYVPKIEKSYDVFLPINITIYEAIKYIESSLSELSNGYYISTDTARLSNRVNGFTYDLDKTIKDSKIYNSTKLVLI